MNQCIYNEQIYINFGEVEIDNFCYKTFHMIKYKSEVNNTINDIRSHTIVI